MLFIDKDEPSIIQARELHLSRVSCRIRRKLNGTKCNNQQCEICNRVTHKIKNVSNEIVEILTDEFFLKTILVGLPQELFEMCELVWSEMVPGFNWQEYEVFLKIKNSKNPTQLQNIIINKHLNSHDLLRKIFDYDDWFKNGKDQLRYDAYQLATNLNRYTCTYCNRSYTHTIKTKDNHKVMRPTFDHWFAHTRHPLLGLSFYNLIPSCALCNSSVKGFKEYLISSHLHPYIDKDCCDHIMFDYSLDDETRKYKINLIPIAGADRAVKSYEDLMIKEIYSSHQSELSDLIRIKDAYSRQYISEMMNTYSAAGLTHEEVYRLAFGVELSSADFHKRPLSKFTKDILSKLKII